MRFEDYGIETVDFLGYDTYVNGIPIEHLDLDWDIPSIYLFPARRKTSLRLSMKFDTSFYHKTVTLLDFLAANLDNPLPA